MGGVIPRLLCFYGSSMNMCVLLKRVIPRQAFEYMCFAEESDSSSCIWAQEGYSSHA